MTTHLNAWLIHTRSQQAHPLIHRDTTVGRLPDNHIVILDDPSVSRQHAMIRYESNVFTLIPLMAKTPMRLNDYMVTAPVQLFHNDALLIGQTQFQFLYTPGGRLS